MATSLGAAAPSLEAFHFRDSFSRQRDATGSTANQEGSESRSCQQSFLVGVWVRGCVHISLRQMLLAAMPGRVSRNIHLEQQLGHVLLVASYKAAYVSTVSSHRTASPCCAKTCLFSPHLPSVLKFIFSLDYCHLFCCDLHQGVQNNYQAHFLLVWKYKWFLPACWGFLCPVEFSWRPWNKINEPSFTEVFSWSEYLKNSDHAE